MVSVIRDSFVDGFTESAFPEGQGQAEHRVCWVQDGWGRVWGCSSVVVTEQGKRLDDPNTFVFSSMSHGQCTTPQWFDERKRG